jgi:hypothetical protein
MSEPSKESLALVAEIDHIAFLVGLDDSDAIRARRIDAYVAERTAAAQERTDELEMVFSISYDANMRAIRQWQAAHPGNDLVWPDHAKMVLWLLERDTALRTAADAMADVLQNFVHSGIWSDRHEKGKACLAAYRATVEPATLPGAGDRAGEGGQSE